MVFWISRDHLFTQPSRGGMGLASDRLCQKNRNRRYFFHPTFVAQKPRITCENTRFGRRFRNRDPNTSVRKVWKTVSGTLGTRQFSDESERMAKTGFSLYAGPGTIAECRALAAVFRFGRKTARK